MVIVYMPPGIVGVKVVVVGAAFVCFAHSTTSFLFRHIVTGHKGLDSFFDACIKEELDEVGIVTENIIGAATHNDARTFVCD